MLRKRCKMRKVITDSPVVAGMFSGVEKKAYGLWAIPVRNATDEAIVVTTCKDKCAWYRIEES